jgi:Short C-terminal domain
MPGLIRGVARTAVVAGTATAVSNRVSRRQANRWAAQDPEPYEQQAYAQPAAPPEPAQPTMDDKIEQLNKLGELKAQGILTDAEFQEQKDRILSS